MRQLGAFLLVHLILAAACAGYTWQNSQQLQRETLWEAVRFALSAKVVPLVLVCNLVFVVTYYVATHQGGLVLFWRWNGFVPTSYEWIGIAVALVGSLVPIIGPQVGRAR